MGLCSSHEKEEMPRACAPIRRYNSYMDVWKSASFHEQPLLIGSELVTDQSGMESKVQQEVEQATSSTAWAHSSGEEFEVAEEQQPVTHTPASLGSSCSSRTSRGSQSSKHRCSCGVGVGSEVLLSLAYAQVTDALEGNLSPGDVGIVSELDDESGLYCVQYQGSAWWYHREAIRLSRCRKPNDCSKMATELDQSLEHQLREACAMSSRVASMACLRWNSQLRMIHPA